VVLYGSVARGAAAPGDVDLLVLLARPEDEEPVRAALLDAVRPVEVRFQLAVQPVVMTAAALVGRRDDALVAAIAADGLLLTGRGPKPLNRPRALPPPPPSLVASSATGAADHAAALGARPGVAAPGRPASPGCEPQPCWPPWPPPELCDEPEPPEDLDPVEP
jgi:hypothetical protein